MSREETSPELTATQRSQIRRLPQRGAYECDLIYEILDEGLVCHVGFTTNEQPFVIPTAYGRVKDTLYIHGSPASRMLQTLQGGVEVCVTVTLLDGLVLARSAFHHSMNYRSVVVFGTATLVKDPQQKLEALQAFTEHIISGRWNQVRPPTRQETQGTLVLSLSLSEASAKLRTGGPVDDEQDYQLPVWAGVIPLEYRAKAPIPDSCLPAEVSIPEHVSNYKRPHRELS